MGQAPEQSDIDSEMDKAMENIDAGTSAYPGMTYEEGVEAAIRWMNGDTPDRPMSED